MIDTTALHRAADRIGDERYTPDMDALAGTIAEFLRTATFSDEQGESFEPHGPSLGYGVMVGYIAAAEETDRLRRRLAEGGA